MRGIGKKGKKRKWKINLCLLLFPLITLISKKYFRMIRSKNLNQLLNKMRNFILPILFPQTKKKKRSFKITKKNSTTNTKVKRRNLENQGIPKISTEAEVKVFWRNIWNQAKNPTELNLYWQLPHQQILLDPTNINLNFVILILISLAKTTPSAKWSRKCHRIPPLHHHRRRNLKCPASLRGVQMEMYPECKYQIRPEISRWFLLQDLDKLNRWSKENLKPCFSARKKSK